MKQRNKGNRYNAINTLKKQLKARATSILREIPATETCEKFPSFHILLEELESSRLVQELHVFHNEIKGTYQAYIRFVGELSKHKPASLHHSTHYFKRANGWGSDQVFQAAVLDSHDGVMALEIAKAYINQNEETEVFILPTGFSVMAFGTMSPAHRRKLFSALITTMEKADELSKREGEKTATLMDFTPLHSYFEKSWKGSFTATLKFLWESFFGPIVAYCLEKGKELKLLAITEIDYCVVERTAMKEFGDARGLELHTATIDRVVFELETTILVKESV